MPRPCMHDFLHTQKNLACTINKLEPRSSILVKPNSGHLYDSEQSQTGWKRIILLTNFCDPHQNRICCNKWHWYSVEYLCYLERTTVRIKVPWCFLPALETLLVVTFKSCLLYSQAVQFTGHQTSIHSWVNINYLDKTIFNCS